MPKIVDHNLYRQELLIGATRVFSERGYGSVTMRGVSQALGVSTGTVYHYFSSKQQLFEAVVASVISNNINEALEALAKENEHATVRQLLDHMLADEAHHMRQYLVLIDYLRLHADRRPLLEPLMIEAHHRYSKHSASLLGLNDPEAGAFALSALFTILESRWIHGSQFVHEPQVVLLERFVAMCREQQQETSCK